MDDIDRQLIGLLSENARTSVASLAKSLKVARGTVQNRLAKLERDGTIAGYTIRLRPAVDERRISAFTTIAVEGARIEPVVRTLRGDPSIVDPVHDQRPLGSGGRDSHRQPAILRSGPQPDSAHRGHLRHRNQPVALDAQAIGRKPAPRQRTYTFRALP